MNRDAIEAELLESEGLLQDEKLKGEDRHALHGAQPAVRDVLDRNPWQPASQTFYQIDNRPIEPASPLIHYDHFSRALDQ